LATWIGVYAFTFQIYFDFSGYTDIALGSAKLLGYELPPNFNRPYAATSITDFWRRWHMSLSTWLRDYLYISLGGNRMASRWGMCRNLMLTMILGGLWHGAAWHFAVWGFLHGLWLSLERLVAHAERSDVPVSRAVSMAKKVAVFHGVAALWIVFRARSIPELWEVTTVMAGSIPSEISVGMVIACLIMICAWTTQLMAGAYPMKVRFLILPIPLKAAPYLAMIALVLLFNSETPKSFIYFQF
jgi:D-alanyl-lipoteichoic acid acyltransferase DltB (MBOAT superfamily)